MTLSGNVHEFDELREHALGWRGLLDGLRAHLEAASLEVRVDQVKEKFGGLCCYVTLPSDDASPSSRATASSVRAVIDAAEGASYLLCYLCGAGTTHRGSGYWVRYFCAQHDTDDLHAARAT